MANINIRKARVDNSSVIIIKGSYSKHLTLAFAPAIKAGFPSPADPYDLESLDFNRDIIKHPDDTFYGKVTGDSMIDAGICEGDIVVVDRSAVPKKGDIIVGFLNHEYTIKFYDDTHFADGYIELVPANENYPVFEVTKNDDFEVWGVVQYSIRSWAKPTMMRRIECKRGTA